MPEQRGDSLHVILVVVTMLELLNKLVSPSVLGIWAAPRIEPLQRLLTCFSVQRLQMLLLIEINLLGFASVYCMRVAGLVR